jgi:hypothetical protein
MNDEQAIRQLIENWVLWRDAGQWECFASLWHPEGRMMTTWSQSSATEFIARSRRAWDGGVKVMHALGGASIEISGQRAVCQSRMEIIQRGTVDGVLVDVMCRGRFWDALEKRGDKWGLMLRQPIYEMDRMALVDPTATLKLDAQLLALYPEGYRHLAYLQTRLGLEVKKNLPGTRGPEIEALLAGGVRWLKGESAVCLE